MWFIYLNFKRILSWISLGMFTSRWTSLRLHCEAAGSHTSLTHIYWYIVLWEWMETSASCCNGRFSVNEWNDWTWLRPGGFEDHVSVSQGSHMLVKRINWKRCVCVCVCTPGAAILVGTLWKNIPSVGPVCRCPDSGRVSWGSRCGLKLGSEIRVWIKD